MRMHHIILVLLLVAAPVAGQFAVAPYLEDFEAFTTPLVLTTGAGTIGLGAEWDFNQPAGTLMARASVDVSTIPLPPTGGVGQVLILDNPANGGLDETNEVVLHIDGVASDSGSGFTIVMFLKEAGDEVDLADVIAITDGTTAGMGVNNDGTSTGAPGLGGHQEVLLADWNNALTGNNQWQQFIFTIDANFLSNNGLTMSNDMRLIIRQSDNFAVPTDGLLIDDVQIIDTNTLSPDLAVVSVDGLTSSIDCTPLSTMEPIGATISNVGQAPVPTGTGIFVSYDIDGVLAGSDTVMLMNDLNPGDTLPFVFTTPADLSMTGAHVVDVTVVFGDPNPANDTATTTILSGGTNVFPYIETFDGSPSNQTDITPMGWSQDLMDNAGTANEDWFFRNTATTSGGTGPTTDNTSGSGYYAYVEDAGNFTEVNLLSPCFDVSALAIPTLRFYVHSNNSQGVGGANENSLHVDVIDAAGNVTMDITSQIGHIGDFWQEILVDLSAFNAMPLQLRFRVDSGNANTLVHDIGIDDVEIFDNIAPDVAIDSIDSPEANTALGCIPRSNAEMITVTFRNAGVILGPGQVVDLSYTVDDGMNPPVVVVEQMTLAAVLDPGDTLQYTFTATADLSAIALYTLAAAVTVVGDSNAANGTIAGHQVQSGGATSINVFPFTEDFDATTVNDTTIPPMDWIQPTDDAVGTQSDWRFRNTATTSGNTGPDADNTTGMLGVGYYAYVEDSAGHHPMVNLLTPCFDTTSLTSPSLQFAVHSNNTTGVMDENLLSIDIIDDANGVVHMDIIPPIGHIGDFWQPMLIDISSFASAAFRVRFRIDSTNGGTNDFTHDIAIDDVTIGEAPMGGGGQAPIVGEATLDVNGSVEPSSGFGVISGLAGPYEASATAGVDDLVITITGLPNQPVLLAYSDNINVNSASFPFGQLDIGTPNTMVPPFIPNNVVVVFTGFGINFPNPFFRTNANGVFQTQFPAPPFPNISFGLQAVVAVPTSNVIQIANAVEVTLN